ncbi:MAG: hypothetical protein IJX81_06440 [Clostridia bacterium]|nr:hypothetical protein [Clostridia bacterium]
MTFAYHGVCDDWWATGTAGQDDYVKTTFDESLATVENLQKYKDAGLNVLFANYVFGFSSTNFENSKLKSVMDMAEEVGLPVIVWDSVLHTLSAKTSSLIVTDGTADGKNTFASQEALTEYLRGYLASALAHPAFYGVSLKDEPSYTMFTAMGEVYKALKTIDPTMYVNMNLLPYSPGLIDGSADTEYYCSGEDDAYVAGQASSTSAAKEACYKAYLQAFYEATGAEILQYDDYPIRESGHIYKVENGQFVLDENGKKIPLENPVGTPYILTTHLLNLKIVAEFCRDNGLQFNRVLQSCAGSTTGLLWKKPTENDFYWQAYLSMAMGVEGYSYWSYYPVINEGSYEHYDETASFVDREGNINENTYYTLQTLHSIMQKYAKMLSYFEYQNMGVYSQYGAEYEGSKSFIEMVNSTLVNVAVTLSELSDEADGAALLVSELYDELHRQYGYWFVNAEDPVHADAVEFEVSFGAGYDFIVVYTDGEYQIYELDEEGKAAFTLECGRAVFVLPY